MFGRNRPDSEMSEALSRAIERSQQAGVAAHEILSLLITPEIAEQVRRADTLGLTDGFRVSVARPIDTAELRGAAVATWDYDDPYRNPEAQIGVRECVSVLGVSDGQVVRGEWGGYSHTSESEYSVDALQLAAKALSGMNRVTQ